MGENKRNIKKDFLVVVLVVILGKILGFFRELVVAYFYGASIDTDAFYYVNSLITAIFTIITLGLGQAFTPTYLDTNIKGGKAASSQFANKIITVIGGLGVVICMFLCIVPQLWINLLAPALSFDTKILASNMLRIMAPCIPFYILFAFQKSILNAHQKYIVTEASGIPYSIAICSFTLLLNSSFGSIALPIAAAIGVLFQFLFTLFFSRNDYIYRPTRFSFQDEEIKYYFILLMPVAAGAILEEANGLLRKALAGGMGNGAIANLSYCMTLTSLINGIIINSISTVYYPHLIKNYSENCIAEFRKNAISCISMASVMVIPLVVFLLRYSNDVVKIVYERGNFTSYDTAQVAPLFAIYVVGSIIYAYRSIIKTVFYATKDPKTPMINEMMYLVICMACNVIQVKFFNMGLNALGIAWVLSILVVTPFLFLKFENIFFPIVDKSVIKEAMRAIVSSAFFSCILFLIDKITLNYSIIIHLGIAFSIALLIYFTCMVMLKSPTLCEAKDAIVRRF